MQRLFIFLGLLTAVDPTPGVTPKWIQDQYISVSTSTIDKFEAFLLCTGWKPTDFDSKADKMLLDLFNVKGKAGIWGFVSGKSRTLPPFEFGKEFNDTLFSGKKARTTINVRKSTTAEDWLLLDITQKLEDGVVVTHKMEVDTDPEPWNPADYALQGKSRCKDVEIFTGWHVVS